MLSYHALAAAGTKNGAKNSWLVVTCYSYSAAACQQLSSQHNKTRSRQNEVVFKKQVALTKYEEVVVLFNLLLLAGGGKADEQYTLY